MIQATEPRHPVAFFYNGIGDHLLALPAIRALAVLFPNRLTLVCESWAGATFFSDLPLRSIVAPGIQRKNGIRNFSAHAVATQIGPCDLLLSLAPWHVDAMSELLGLLSPKHSIGFAPVFDEVLLIDHFKHNADGEFEVARRLDPRLRIEDFSRPAKLPNKALRDARAIRDSLAANVPVLVIHADTARQKMWDINKWECFLDFVLDHHRNFVVFVVGLCSSIPERRDRVFRFYGCSLPMSLALVNVADLFVGVDSCMLHAADLFGVPGLGLFGPTSATEWGFRFTAGRHVQGNGTMESIPVNQVILAFEQLVREFERRPVRSLKSPRQNNH